MSKIEAVVAVFRDAWPQYQYEILENDDGVSNAFAVLKDDPEYGLDPIGEFSLKGGDHLQALEGLCDASTIFEEISLIDDKFHVKMTELLNRWDQQCQKRNQEYGEEGGNS